MCRWRTPATRSASTGPCGSSARAASRPPCRCPSRSPGPLPLPVARAIDAAAGDRDAGPLLRRADGQQLDRRTAHRWVNALGKAAGLGGRLHPHALRHTMVTLALNAGVPLRDVQAAARHADPRMTERYDRQRGDLGRHAAHVLAAYVADVTG